MEQRDYLMRQIEQLGQVLARALARLLNIKQLPSAALNLEEIKQVYSDELDLSLDLILQVPKEGLIELLTSKVKFMDRHLEKMAEILSETADLYENSDDDRAARDLREKSILLYEYMQESTGAFSLERALKITQLKGRL